MDAIKINQILTDYIRHNLSPTQPERDMISSKYSQLNKILPGQTFQNGSYARFTSTTPVNDLDVIYILPESVKKMLIERQINPAELSVNDILNDLAKALNKEYKGEARIIVQPHSVGIFFGEKSDFSIDVVPAQPIENGLYLVPETSLHSVKYRRILYESKPVLKWIKSDPIGYINQAAQLDNNSKGNFRKAAKFMKKWKQGCKIVNDIFPLKSFHLEIVLTEFIKNNPQLGCYESLQMFYSKLPSVITKPQYPDKADKSKFIDEYISTVTQNQLDIARNEISRGLELMKNIGIANTEAQLLKLIEEHLRVGTNNTQIAPVTIRADTRASQAFSKPYYS